MLLNRVNKYKGYLTVDELTVKTKLGNSVIRELLVKKSGVGSIVYNTITKKFLFVEQWRPGSNNKIIEIAAGTLDIAGEDIKEAMIREIDEELGYKTDSIKIVDEFYTSPGAVNELITVFYSEVSEKIHEGGGLENEDIDIIEMSIDELLSTRFNDAKTIIGINYIKENITKFK